MNIFSNPGIHNLFREQMTEIEYKSNKTTSHPDSEASQASEKLYHERINDLKGRRCHIQPKPDEIPHMIAGKKTKGCDYRNYSSDGEQKDGAIDIPSLYRHGKGMAVYIEARARELHHTRDSLGSGSGVIVGKRGTDELLVLTANHVVGSEKGEKLKKVRVRTADGDVKDGKVVEREPKEDLALIAVRKDPAEMSKYEVATAINSLKDLKPGARALGVGFPMDSETAYASPGTFISLDREKDLSECTNANCYGEDWNRLMVNMRMQAHEGNSGFGVWNGSRKIIGVLNGGTDGDITHAQLNPVTQSKIDNMIRKAKPYDQH